MKKIFSLSFILLFCCSLAFAGPTPSSNTDKSLTATTPQQNLTEVAKEAAPQSLIATSPDATEAPRSQAYTGSANPTPSVQPTGLTATNPNVAPTAQQKEALPAKKAPEQNAYVGAAAPPVELPADKKEYTPPPADPNVILQGGDNIGTATVIPSLPYSDVGTNIGYANDYEEVCPYSSTSPDVVYSYAPVTTEIVSISLCGNSDYDTKLFVYENAWTPGAPYACNDDACSSPLYPNYVSRLDNLTLTGGNTYYIVVDGYGGSVGNYTLDVFPPPICDVTCPPEGILEGEPDCGPEYVDMYNGGCNSSPWIFQNITPGDVICATSGTYMFGVSQYRDTDWFRVVFTEATLVHWKGVAEFPLLLFVISDPTENCALTILGQGTADCNDTARVDVNVPPGVYYMWAGPQVFTGWPCPLEYVASLTTEAGPPCVPDFLVEAPGIWTGTTCGAGDDCALRMGEDHIYEINIPTDGNWIFSLCGTPSPWDTYMFLGTSCCSQDIGYNDDYCGALSQITANVAAGTYYLDIEPYSNGYCGDYQLDVYEAPPGPPNDNCVDVTIDPLNIGDVLTYTGNNSNATSDCYLLGWPEVWFAFTTTEQMDVTIDVCGSPTYFGTLGIVYTMDCPCSAYYVASSYGWTCDDGNWELQIYSLPAGTYYYPMYSGPGYTGDYTLHITGRGPCVVECPPEGIPEGEECYDEYVDNFNGGCNSSPNVFSSYTFGDIVCGTSGTYLYQGGQYRDTDWFRVELAQNQLLTLNAVAEFPLQLLLIDAMNDDCVNYIVDAYGYGNPCDTVSIQWIATAGVWYLWVGPSVFSGVQCPSDYTMWATAEEPPPPPVNDNCVDVTPDPLPAGTTLTYNGNNEFATSDCGLLGWPEVWHAFTSTEELNVTIDFCETSPYFPTAGVVLTDCPCSQLVYAAGYDFTTCGDNNITMRFMHLPAGTYYYPIYSAAGNTGDYTMHIYGETPPPPPPNDLCENAIAMTVPSSVTGSTISATVDVGLPNCPGVNTAPGIWYVVQGTGNYMTATTCADYTNYDTKISIYCNTCEEIVCVGGNDDNCALPNHGLNSTFSWCSDPTETYFILVHGYSSNTGDFQLDVYDDGTPCSPPFECVYVPPPANDNCQDVTPVPLFPDTPLQFTGDNTGATVDCPYGGWAEVWEAITTEECMDVTIDYCGTDPYFNNVYIIIDDACPCDGAFIFASNWDAVSCADGLNWTVRWTSLPAGTYWIPILTDVGAQGPYVMNVTGVACPPPPPNPCDGAIYTNHVVPGTGAYASQCDPVYPFQAGVADDFILPGPDPTEDIVEVDLWTQFWNGPMDPNNVTAVEVTFYADNGGIPGGRPIGTDPACAHQEDIPGGVISEQIINPPDFSWVAEPNGTWQLQVIIPAVNLSTGVTYWVEVAPIMEFGTGGQIGWTPSDIITGNPAQQIFSIIGYPDWQCNSMGCIDVAFCLHTPGGGCVYMPGDINNNGDANGVDVTYGVNYFKGFGPPSPIDCGTPVGPCPEASPFYAAGDVNANCVFNGVDITYYVNYLKGIGPPLTFCQDCPPAALAAPGQINPAIQPSKAKIDASGR